MRGAVILAKPARDGRAREIESKLLGLARRMAELREILRAAREGARQAEAALREREAELVLEIAFEPGPGGKPRFGNESLRGAELARRKASDPSYRAAEARWREARRALEEAEDALAAARDEWEAWKAIARMRAAEMRAAETAGGGA